MRRIALLLILVIAASAEAQRLRDLRQIAQAEGCTTTVIASCDATVRAQLASGDCLFDDGTRYDRYVVTLPPSRSVAVTLRPLASSYTNPWLAVVPPASDSYLPPAVGGPIAATVWIQTGAAGGTWTIFAGTNDLFAGGEYALHVDCFEPESNARDCVTQELLCGHRAEATLSAESCRYQTVNRAYGNWSFYGRVGDFINIEMTSLAFEPLFGIYDDQFRLLVSSQRASSSMATLAYLIPATGWYIIGTTSTQDNQGGDYEVSLRCTTSGCLFPYLRSNIPDFTVDRGARATIDLDLSVVGPFTASLLDGITVVASSTTTRLVTPSVVARQPLIAKVESPCGTAESNVFIVQPKLSKRHAARH